MNTKQLMRISSEEFEDCIKGLYREEIDELIADARNELLLFVKEYLENEKPNLTAISPKSPYANFEFVDNRYGNVKVIFFGNSSRKFYRYYVTSEEFADISKLLTMFPATSNNTATGKFKVNYIDDGIIKHYYINVGKEEQD